MLKATYFPYELIFKQASGTSRGILKTKLSYLIKVWDDSNPQVIGIGECGLLKGLSIDDRPDYEEHLKKLCANIHQPKEKLWESFIEFPSIQFGLEIALLDLEKKGNKILFPSDFTDNNAPISINGLIWMGEKSFMFDQIKAKLTQGYDCIKLKIGAIDFEEELSLLKYIRSQFSAEEITLRVDANGAFAPSNALEKLKRLSEYDIHSIEQPIKQHQWDEMALLCQQTPLDIALDEELIGVFSPTEKERMIETIQPQYLIFKPSFIGGFKGTSEWIELCKKHQMDWWMTSALESNIGLNAISQWTYTLDNPLPQGLGTGQLYTNNIASPLYIDNGNIHYQSDGDWAEV